MDFLRELFAGFVGKQLMSLQRYQGKRSIAILFDLRILRGLRTTHPEGEPFSTHLGLL